MNRKPSFMFLLVIALLALLPLLAVRQYRWLGQVSEGERERMRNNLTATARQFCQDFDSELTAIYLLFQPTPAPFNNRIDQDSQPGDDFAVKYRRWRETAAHPRLVKEIYQTQSGENDRSLARYNAETGAFDLCEWPDGLARMRKTLEESRAAHETARVMLSESVERKIKINVGSGVGVKKTVFQLALGSVDEDLPGLIIPVGIKPIEEALTMPGLQSLRIVALDLDYIKQELIPELTMRHFGAAADYKIAVTKRGRPEETLFRSDNAISETALTGGDVTAGFFKVRENEFNRFLLTHLPQGGSGSASNPTIESKHHQIAISVASDVKLEKGAPLPAPPGSQARAVVDDVRQSLLGRNSEGVWRLVIKHRAGSLEAAVTRARHRNLAISFGILLLLGVSVGFIVLSSRRAERLATQQMEFVAGVSHELRTPLAVICSAAENLADGVIDNSDQIKRYGGLIRDEGRRLTGMVEQVLEFAGAQSMRKGYELRAVNLDQVIEDAITACNLQLDEGGFEIERQISADLPLVRADAAALSRAIQNLLSNAMKYSGESRWIGLNAEFVKTAGAEEVHIRVSDRGLGIATSELERVFEPFYRGKDAMAAQIRGNGLGLSLVNHIVAAHGGRMSVESKVGQGSRFTLRLPVPAVEESSARMRGENEYETPSQLKAGPSRSGD